MNPLLSGLLRAGLFGAGLAATFLPRRVELWLGPRLGRLALALDTKRRRIAYDNIRLCLPELGPAGWEKILEKNSEHYGLLTLELLHLFSPVPGHYRAYARRITVVEGYENWKRARDKGKGVLYVTAHLANWEAMAASGATRGMPITMVTRRLKPEWLHRKIAAQRLSGDCQSLASSHGLPSILRALRRGESVGFAMDQYAAPPMGMPVAFFGARVDTLAAVGSLALRTGAAVVPVAQRRDASGLIRVAIEPALELGDALADPAKSTALLAAKVEGWIRRSPHEWLWVHRRFKNAVWAPADPAPARRA